MNRHNPVASRWRRLPYVAKIKRDDPFHPEDECKIDGMCKCIAAAGEYMALAGWREDPDCRVFHLGTWAKARAMQHWIDRSGISHRPRPKLGETAQERAERQREALAWGLETGTVYDIVQAYRQARDRGESELTAFNAAANVALALGRSLDMVNDTACVLLNWALKTNRNQSRISGLVYRKRETACASRLWEKSRARRNRYSHTLELGSGSKAVTS
jgi:hypothetical protein